MKWIAFMLAVVAAYPAGQQLRGRPRLQLHLWTLIGLLPFLPSLDMALIAFTGRALGGDTMGVEVALLDWLVLSLLFAQEGPARTLPYRFALAAYLLSAVLSMSVAWGTMAAFGYVWKVLRMYLVFAVVCRAASDTRVPMAILRGMMMGVLYEFAWTAWQHFGLGIQRAPGTFGHGNTLGALVNLVVMAPLALVFAGRTRWLTLLAPIVALPAALFTVSRGSLLFFAVGAVLVWSLSAYRRYDVRKAAIGLAGLVTALALVPVVVTTIGSRTSDEQESSMLTRRQYEHAATLMLEEHPLGVGPANFSIMLLARGYGTRAGISWRIRTAIVHNIYLLTAAEMGYPGVVTLLLLFAVPLVDAFRWGLRARGDRRGDLLVGLGVGLAVFYVHSLFEWVWRLTPVTYVYWMLVAIVASLARQLRDDAFRRLAVARRAAREAFRERLGTGLAFGRPLARALLSPRP